MYCIVTIPGGLQVTRSHGNANSFAASGQQALHASSSWFVCNKGVRDYAVRACSSESTYIHIRTSACRDVCPPSRTPSHPPAVHTLHKHYVNFTRWDSMKLRPSGNDTTQRAIYSNTLCLTMMNPPLFIDYRCEDRIFFRVKRRHYRCRWIGLDSLRKCDHRPPKKEPFSQQEVHLKIPLVSRGLNLSNSKPGCRVSASSLLREIVSTNRFLTSSSIR